MTQRGPEKVRRGRARRGLGRAVRGVFAGMVLILGVGVGGFFVARGLGYEMNSMEPALTYVGESVMPALAERGEGDVVDAGIELDGVELDGVELGGIKIVEAETGSGDEEYWDEGYWDEGMAVAILTRPDVIGGQRGVVRETMAWGRERVGVYYPENTVHDEAYRDVVWEALAWAGEVSGIEFYEVGGRSEAAVVISAKERGNGGSVQVAATPEGEIQRAEIVLGCCLERTAYEEIGQMLGALGDQGDSRSIFSQDRSAGRPSAFDEWVLRALYRVGAGAGESEIRDALRSSR